MGFRKIFDDKNNKLLILKNRKNIDRKDCNFIINNYKEYRSKKIIPDDDFLFNINSKNIDNFLIKFIPEDYDGLSIEGIVIKPIKVDNAE